MWVCNTFPLTNTQKKNVRVKGLSDEEKKKEKRKKGYKPFSRIFNRFIFFFFGLFL